MIDRLGQVQPGSQVSQVSQVTIDERAMERLRNVASGDTISGRVVGFTTDAQGNRTAMVDLGNGAMVNARLSAGLALQNGENIAFTVRQASGGTVTLSPLYTNTAASSTITQALSAAGLYPSETMTEMVRAMMNDQMAIDRNALLQMSANLNNFPNVNVTTLVHMSHLNVPLLESNIEMFEAYENYEHQVVAGMEQIFDALPDSFNALLQQEDFGTAMDMYGQVMELFSEEMPDAAELTDAAPEEMPATVQPEAEDVPVIQDGTLSTPAQADALASPEELLKNAIAARANETDAPADSQRTDAQMKDIASENALAADKGGIQETQSAGYSKAFIGLLKEVGVSDETIGNLLKNPEQNRQGVQNPFSALINELSAAYAKTAHTSEHTDKQWTSLFSTKEYNAVLKEAISAQWLLRPSDVAEKENVSNLYRRLNAQTKALTDILSSTAGADSKVAQSVNTLAKNVEFMQDLNQMYNYVQLPLKLQGDNAHGDLYVYRNKNHSMADPEGETSAFLHLDMDNLGPVDVFIKLKDVDVTTNFTLADDEAMDLIEAHLSELEARIMKRGYQVTITTGLKTDESVNPVIDRLLQVDSDRIPVFAGAFDARA